ncbi:MAG: cyanophycin synthetase [bacterium]
MRSVNKLIYRWIEDKFMHGCSDYNSLEVRKKSRTKLQARESFAEHNIPHARGTLFTNPWTAFRFVQQHGFPVVIKPNVSGYSRGSHFPITNFREFWKAVILVKIWWPSSIIEEYLLGKNYRVVVIKDEIMSVIRRYPPFVVGDGEKTISQLIDEENRQREELGLLPVIHLISKNRRTLKYLKKQNRSLSTVPAKGEEVFLYNKIALAPGGIVETIDTNTISAKNRELFFKIRESFDANIFGIDVIFEKGIEFDYDRQKCIFLELNSRPFLEMHKYPRFGARPDLDSYFAKLDAIQLADSGIF